MAATATPAASNWYCLHSWVKANARRCDAVLVICCDASVHASPEVIASSTAMLPKPAVILLLIFTIFSLGSVFSFGLGPLSLATGPGTSGTRSITLIGRSRPSLR